MQYRVIRSTLIVLFGVLFIKLSIPLLSSSNFFSQFSAIAEEGKETHKSGTTKRIRRPLRRSSSSSSSQGSVVRERETIGSTKPVDHKNLDSELQKGTIFDIVLLLDSSGSMQRNNSQQLRDRGASLLVRFLTEQDRLAIIQFDSETKVISELTTIDLKNLKSVDDLILSASVEGRFTDLESPVAQALEMLIVKGRPEAIKCVVLITDGKMDPNPKIGSAEKLTETLFKVDLERYRKHSAKLFTIAISEEADRDLLARMAAETGGNHWFAKDINTIHRSFSDLFLTLKKPQVLEADHNGFEIEAGTQEVTFYVGRKDPVAEIEIINPQGQEISNTNIPAGFRWFKGEMFDVITVSSPTPGKWAVWGIDEVEGFASLLTDLHLQVHWPTTNLNIGDSVLVVSRLLDKEKVFDAPGLEGVVFFNYKIINTETGAVVSSGILKDDGSNGDEHSGDKLYSATIQANDVGTFKALITVTGPTFTRQQQVPFTVSGSLISLSLDEGKSDHPPGFLIKVSDRVPEIEKMGVELIVKNTGDKQSQSLAVTKVEGSDRHYRGETEGLKAGAYEVHARLLEGHNKDPKAYSNEVSFTKVEKKEPVPETPKHEKTPKHEEEHEAATNETPSEKVETVDLAASGKMKEIIVSSLLTFLSAGSVFGLWVFANKKVVFEKNEIENVERPVFSKEIENRLTELRHKATKEGVQEEESSAQTVSTPDVVKTEAALEASPEAEAGISAEEAKNKNEESADLAPQESSSQDVPSQEGSTSQEQEVKKEKE